MTPSREITRLVIGLMFFFSGATGLIYEVLWAKYLGFIVGNAAHAQAMVLAIFLGGLMLGHAWLGQIADRSQQPLRLYASLEIGIGLLAGASIWGLTGLADSMLRTASALGVSASGMSALEIAVALGVMLPPTILMGGTLPVLSRFVTTRLGTLQQTIGGLYCVNSVGATVGALAAGFLLIPWVGLDATMGLSVLINLTIGAAAWSLARRASGHSLETVAPDERTPVAEHYSAFQVRFILVAVAISGFVSLAYEIAWIRLLSLTLGSSTYAFSLMLAAFIAGIGLGSWLVNRQWVPGKNALVQFGLAEAGVALAILATLPFYERLPFWFATFARLVGPQTGADWPLSLLMFVLSFGLMLLPATCLGMTLPLATRVATRSLAEVGTQVGRVFACNTGGNMAGALLTGAILLPWLGIAGVIKSGVAINLLLGAAAIWAVPRQWTAGRAASVGVTALIIGISVFGVPPLDPSVMAGGVYRANLLGQINTTTFADFKRTLQTSKAVFYRDDASATVAVMSDDDGDLDLRVNGKSEASEHGDLVTQILLAHIPLVLNPGAKNALVIGLGSGITAGSALTHPLAALDVVEISPAVVDASRLFERANRNALADPRLHLWQDDAMRFMRLTHRTYDVVISEPSNPWMAGVGNLYSTEFYADIAHHLAPGGLMVQWIHTYEMDDPTFQLVLRTFQSAFPQVTLWQGEATDVLLVGSLAPQAPDYTALATRLALPTVRSDLARIQVHDLTTFLGLQMVPMERMAAIGGKGPLNHLRFPLLEYQAPLAFYRNTVTRLPHAEDVRPTFRIERLLLGRFLRARGAPLTTNEFAGLFGYQFGQLGQFAMADIFLNEWLRRYADDEVARWSLVRSLRHGGRPEQSLTQLAPLLKGSPDNSDYVGLAANIEFELFLQKSPAVRTTDGSLGRIVTHMNHLAILHPERRFWIYRKLAHVQLEAGHVGEATAALEQAELVIGQGSPGEMRELNELWLAAANLAAAGGDDEGAQRCARKVLAREPGHPVARQMDAEFAQRIARRRTR